MGTIIKYPRSVWPWSRIPKVAEREPKALTSISDPTVAFLFGLRPSLAGVTVSESTALALSAVWRAVELISTTIAGLPLDSLRRVDANTVQPVSSFLDNPAGPNAQTKFEWLENVVAVLLLQGRILLVYRHNGAGVLVGLTPIHPNAYTKLPRTAGEPKRFTVTHIDGRQRTYTQGVTCMELLGKSLDGGETGCSVLTYARNSLGTAIAGDNAAASMFRDGALFSGLVTPKDEDSIDPDDVETIKAELREHTAGIEHAGGLVFVNKRLEFDAWTMSAQDAQFLESRQFEVEEIARWFGVPPHLLMQTEKQTSWGTGVTEQNRGLGRYTLSGWTSRIEQRLSLLIGPTRYARFDFAGLERPTPEDEIKLLIEQVNAGVITPNEARAARHLPPVEGGDTLRVRPGLQLPAAATAPALPEDVTL
jgi:HK97 family phage portal protein